MSGVKNKNQQEPHQDSSNYVKEVYDDLFETYQLLFEHMRKVDLLIKNKDSKK